MGREWRGHGGDKVCMHSIAEYRASPKQADFTARITKKHGGRPPRHFVPPVERKSAAT